MLTAIFLICAIIGGAVLVIQFIMLLVGMGGSGGIDFDLEVELPDDIDFDLDADVDVGEFEDASEGAHDSSWFFGVLSFRSLVAAVAFFGVTGMIAHTTGGMHPVVEFLIAMAGGIMAMFIVYWLLLGVKSLAEDGTTKIETAIGKVGSVYIPIPAEKAAAGKIQIKVNNRLEEFAAITTHNEKLATGTRVQVIGVAGKGTLVVQLPKTNDTKL